MFGTLGSERVKHKKRLMEEIEPTCNPLISPNVSWKRTLLTSRKERMPKIQPRQRPSNRMLLVRRPYLLTTKGGKNHSCLLDSLEKRKTKHLQKQYNLLTFFCWFYKLINQLQMSPTANKPLLFLTRAFTDLLWFKVCCKRNFEIGSKIACKVF